MRRTICSIVLGLGLLVAPITGQNVFASEKITLHSAPLPLSAFKIRKLKAKGLSTEPKPGFALDGYLFRPEGPGPHPAVIMNHDCRGIQTFQKNMGERLAKEGFVALLVDSYKTRNVAYGSVCKNIAEWASRDFVGGRTRDIYGAAIWLMAQDFVKNDGIGVLGWDLDTSMASVSLLGVYKEYPEIKIAAVVSNYPDCKRMGYGEFVTPVLIQTGAKSDWWGSRDCHVLKSDSAKTSPVPIELVVFDEAGHGFDDPSVGDGYYIADAWNNRKVPAFGATFVYHEKSAKQAANNAISFFGKHLK